MHFNDYDTDRETRGCFFDFDNFNIFIHTRAGAEEMPQNFGGRGRVGYGDLKFFSSYCRL